ncbi:MAG TPA: ABC transporter permease [Terriglobia bacterium]|nr:ABC transporter permease [Terriglobia bacterium]
MMRIPVKYNLGSLWVRRVGSAMTALGIGLTVSIFITMLALVHGLNSTFVETGQDNQLIVIRAGALNEVNSYFDRDLYQTVRLLPGIAVNENKEPLASGEIIVVVNHPRLTGEASNVMVRGMTSAGLSVRPEARLVTGRWFRRGLREIVVSEPLSKRLQNMRLDDTIHMSRSEWKVVGIFDTGGTAYDSEIWTDYEDVAQDWDRPIYSSILLKPETPGAAQTIVRRIADDRRIHLQAISQKEYYLSQTSSSVGIKILGTFIATLMGIGSCFAAMNMMYGAVMSRSREIGTLRALGFSRWSILTSFLLESVCLSLVGGTLGCLMALPIHGISTATANFVTFSEVVFNFRITSTILLQGLCFAAIVGVLGGGLPARRASQISILQSMME